METALLLKSKARRLRQAERQEHQDYPNFETLVGAEGWQNLCPAIQRRFSNHDLRTTYPGDMRCRATLLGAIFTFILRAFGDPLPMCLDTNFKTNVNVYPDGQNGIVWQRIFSPQRGKAIKVESTKRLAANGNLVECVRQGWLGSLRMRSAVSEQDGALVFESHNYQLNFLGLTMNVPEALTPGRTRVEHRDLGRGQFRFRMTMTHPWFGETINQDGVFRDND